MSDISDWCGTNMLLGITVIYWNILIYQTLGGTFKTSLGGLFLFGLLTIIVAYLERNQLRKEEKVYGSRRSN